MRQKVKLIPSYGSKFSHRRRVALRGRNRLAAAAATTAGHKRIKREITPADAGGSPLSGQSNHLAVGRVSLSLLPPV